MKYVHYDPKTGRVLGFYDSELHNKIPEPNIQISDQLWFEAINKHYNYIDIKTGKMKIKDFRTRKQKLEDVKKVKLKRLERIVEKKLHSYTTRKGFKFCASISNINKLKNLHELAVTRNLDAVYVTENNTTYKLSITEIVAIYEELFEFNQKILQKKYELEQKIFQCQEIKCLNCIDLVLDD